MGQYTKWIEYKGQRILFTNCSKLGFNEAEFLKAFDGSIKELSLLPEKSIVLTATDVSKLTHHTGHHQPVQGNG